MQALTPELAMRDAGSYLRWLSDHPQTADGPVGVTGYRVACESAPVL
ncbi:dienelactone hydrolase [Lipingzhangella halophila]|uniref:Dienelactone hydrolase n=1 Tax=Lipingzhangella halophila TaxID=1783352 RepID=A0A7W7RNY8_9ACTN|nr:dienelactone hydrolase [Lipingzhangella halophila]